MNQHKFRLWIPPDEDEPGYMISGDDLAFEEYAPLCHLLNQKGISEYSGMNDKNGVEIYDYDVVRLQNDAGFHCLALVKKIDGCFEVIFSTPLSIFENGKYILQKSEYLKVFVKKRRIEVIGNILSNPELFQKV